MDGAEQQTISLCMIVRNEERFLAQCLRSVRSVVSEIILVDTGSTDRTIEIANDFGAKVHHFTWIDDFAAARNFGIEKASGKWILVLDADEAIAERDLPRLIALTQHPTRCYQLQQRHYINEYRVPKFQAAKGAYPEWERHYQGYFDNPLARLFPNDPRLRFEGRLHEIIDPCIARYPDFSIHSANIPMHHYGLTPEVVAEKNKRTVYRTLGIQKTEESPDDVRAHYELGIEYLEIGDYGHAALELLTAVQLMPHQIRLYMPLSFALHKLGRGQEALLVLADATAICPNNADGYSNLGAAYIGMKEYELAKASFCKAIELNPTFIAAIKNLAIVFELTDNYPEAVLCLRKAITLLPRNEDLHAKLVVAYLRTGELQKAQTALQNLRHIAEHSEYLPKLTLVIEQHEAQLRA